MCARTGETCARLQDAGRLRRRPSSSSSSSRTRTRRRGSRTRAVEERAGGGAGRGAVKINTAARRRVSGRAGPPRMIVQSVFVRGTQSTATATVAARTHTYTYTRSSRVSVAVHAYLRDARTPPPVAIHANRRARFVTVTHNGRSAPAAGRPAPRPLPPSYGTGDRGVRRPRSVL